MWSASQNPFLESMAEAGKSVVDALDGNILYINVMNRQSVDCDTSPAEPDMHDIGILNILWRYCPLESRHNRMQVC